MKTFAGWITAALSEAERDEDELNPHGHR